MCIALVGIIKSAPLWISAVLLSVKYQAKRHLDMDSWDFLLSANVIMECSTYPGDAPKRHTAGTSVS